MSKATVHNIQNASPLILAKGFYLVLLHATKKPPHIALLIEGKLFALSTKGPEINQHFSAMDRLIHKQQIPSLFIELNLPEIADYNSLKSICAKILNSYIGLESGVITCLHPIKDLMNTMYKINTTGIDFVFELLPELQKNNIVGNCFQYNMERYLSSLNEFALQTYSMFDVSENIYKANQKLQPIA